MLNLLLIFLIMTRIMSIEFSSNGLIYTAAAVVLDNYADLGQLELTEPDLCSNPYIFSVINQDGVMMRLTKLKDLKRTEALLFLRMQTSETCSALQTPSIKHRIIGAPTGFSI